MKKVKCINNDDVSTLSINKIYNVIYEDRQYYSFNEFGLDCMYSKWRFVKAEENPNNPTHYQTKIQPIEYIEANNLGFHEGNVIKYITRYKDKNGIEDLEKAKTYIEMLIDKLKRENV